MGVEQSSEMPDISAGRFGNNDIYMPMSMTRSNEDRSGAPDFKIDNTFSQNRNSLIKSAFNSIWSTHIPEKITPEARTSHFTVNVPSLQCSYIGFGLGENGEPLDNIWRLDYETREWEPVFTEKIIPPRSGARAVYYRNSIIIFGGFANSEYLNDIYVLNLESHNIIPLQCTGPAPTPRSAPIMEVVGDELFIWAGFDGQWLNDLYVLDLTTLSWSLHPQEINGRTNIPSIVYGDYIYAYGGSKSAALLGINTKTKTVEIITTTGPAPPPAAMGGGMVLIKDHLVYFGGRTNYAGTLVYACNIEKKWWFVFHVIPDGDSVSFQDGKISELGLFMLPKMQGMSVSYDEDRRDIIAYLGEPYDFPLTLNILHVAPALAHINLRDDMTDALHAFM